MAEQGEATFVKSFISILRNQPITYGNDYQQPPQNSLKKISALGVQLPDPPEKIASTSSSASITIHIKSTKPPHIFTIGSFSTTSSIAELKAHLFSSQTNAPPPEAQRLLLKGKALIDTKLLMDYSIKNGDTINLVIKPGFTWDPTVHKAVETEVQLPKVELFKPDGSVKPHKGGHQRIPSVVLSPSPSPSSPPSPSAKNIILTLDPSSIPTASEIGELSSYHLKMSSPVFWQNLRQFLKTQNFASESDELNAFEDFFLASKGTLTANQIAYIRDSLDVTGMAGT